MPVGTKQDSKTILIDGSPQSDFVMACIQEGSKDKYYCIDRETGYPSWTDRLFGAHLFKSHYDAVQCAEKVASLKPHICGKTRYPATEIHSALDLCHKKKAGKGYLVIKKVQLSLPLDTFVISGAIEEGAVTFPD